ncbi:4Fe-4S dicluster domain-containing protein [uncultured Cohaesibacter sp.]|uniref:4Fe-4S dicluster domain-containing protein n=1 Tax=uncultured Cohaesibacter sp. TaxID=1002546 RepID=UPI00292E9933|nr:4Fe-4S dicluster domain-containing protein [uncultured Cohaesibacter sp.]
MKARAAEGSACGGLCGLRPVRCGVSQRASISATAHSLACIQCGLCIDACDNVMEKIGKPRVVSSIMTPTSTSSATLRARKASIALIRPRTVIYIAMISLVCGLMVFSLINRKLVDLNVLHDRNPLFVHLVRRVDPKRLSRSA